MIRVFTRTLLCFLLLLALAASIGGIYLVTTAFADDASVVSSDTDAGTTPGESSSSGDAGGTTQPTPTAAEVPTTPEMLASGDLNGDSRVNIADALSLFRFVNGQLTVTDFGTDNNGNLKGDFNLDGRLNITDALKLFRYVNGQLTVL